MNFKFNTFGHLGLLGASPLVSSIPSSSLIQSLINGPTGYTLHEVNDDLDPKVVSSDAVYGGINRYAQFDGIDSNGDKAEGVVPLDTLDLTKPVRISIKMDTGDNTDSGYVYIFQGVTDHILQLRYSSSTDLLKLWFKSGTDWDEYDISFTKDVWFTIEVKQVGDTVTVTRDGTTVATHDTTARS